jgi:hypothetical protein
MASWAAIPMLSGFRYDARAQRMDLAPRINASDFQCFWSAAGGWGSFELNSKGLTLTAVAGAVVLKELTIVPFGYSSHGKVEVTSAEREIGYSATRKDGGIVLQFSQPLKVQINQPLRVQIS